MFKLNEIFFSFKLIFLLKLKEMFLPNDIADLILGFLPDYELLEWIDFTSLRWFGLWINPIAIHLLEQNKDKIYWDWLSRNPSAIHLLEQNKDKINWNWLSRNTAAMHLLEQNKDKINWDLLSRNLTAIHLLQEKIDWSW